VIEFDRGGTDVVMYQYEDARTIALVEESGARVGNGSFSDISYLDHLGVKAFNWGVGYQDYHSVRSHAYLDDLFLMLDHFVEFHDVNADVVMPHKESSYLGGDLTPSEWDAIEDMDERQYLEWWRQNYETDDEPHGFDYAAHDEVVDPRYLYEV
jgi:hypothetical protein